MDDATEQRLNVTQEGTNGDVRLVLVGELDPHTAPALREALDTALAGEPSSLAMDLTDLRFIDSSGLRVLIDAHRALSERGAELVVHNPSDTAKRLLEITKLDSHFRIDETG